MPRWSVDIIRHRAKHLGTVVAANENDAIKAAIATIEIEPARRNRPKISIASFAPRALAEFTSMTAAYDGLAVPAVYLSSARNKYFASA
jgi:hypothetical protein